MNFYEPTETRTAIDFIEPETIENPYREASLAYFRIISLATSYILEADEPIAAAWGIAFALGLVSVTENRTQREIARELGISHGTISVHSKRFSRICGLPESALMKTAAQVKQSRESRNNFCQL